MVEPEKTKAIRRKYTAKQMENVVLYARHHGVRPTERKFGIPRRNIQRWLKNIAVQNTDQTLVTKRGPKNIDW